MMWRLDLSKNAEKFLDKNRLTLEEVRELAGKALRYFRGEDINIDIKKLKGVWTGFYRIRSGRLSIIVTFDFEETSVLVEEIDWRGNAY